MNEKPGLYRTNETEMYQKGIAAGEREREKGLSEEAIDRRLRFDRYMADHTDNPVFAAYHEGRYRALKGVV